MVAKLKILAELKMRQTSSYQPSGESAVALLKLKLKVSRRQVEAELYRAAVVSNG